MLANLTIISELVSMGATMWLAFYLFARGFQNRITRRAVLCLLALSIFFLGTYNNFFSQVSGSGSLRAVLLIIGFACWYSATFQLLSPQNRARFQRIEFSIYVLCLVTVTLLLTTRSAFIREQGDNLYVARMDNGFVFVIYGFTLGTTSLGLLFNLLLEKRIYSTAQGKYFLLASVFPTLAVAYGGIALIVPQSPMPRLIEDLLVFSGVFLLGISVSRYQSFVERRTTLQDFPATGLMIAGLLFFYILMSLKLGLPIQWLGVLTASVIITHSVYDLGREVLERLRIRNESRFRKELRLIESEISTDRKLQSYLQDGLNLLCATLNTSAGVIAIRRDDRLIVTAARNSAEVGEAIDEAQARQIEISRLNGEIRNIEWVAPAFEAQKQIALVGIGSSATKLEYSSGDLDLFAEFADLVGTVVSLRRLQPQTNENILQLVEESQILSREMESAAEDLLDTLAFNPEAEFVKMVEDGLRKYSDFITLGQSPLAEWIRVDADSHIERGKQVQRILRSGVETLRPAEARPPEPLPRNWYNYVVLHDAYVKGVVNREVMARLYISEGTFNRTRRNAVRGVARWLIEENRSMRKSQ